MYKLLLCWRYLLTRYLALACIVSIMLGVATLIVVNSVMGGFSTKLKDRLHGLLSDLLIETTTFDGFPDPEEKMRRIRQSPIGDKIAAMTPTLEVFALIQFSVPGEAKMFTRPVRLIGIEPHGRAQVGGFAEYLIKQKNKEAPSFSLDEEAMRRLDLQTRPIYTPDLRSLDPNDPPPPEPPPSTMKIPEGIIVGNAIASFRDKRAHSGEEVKDIYMLQPGDNVIISTVSGELGDKMSAVCDRFAVCDYFKSGLSDYDGNYVFVPLHYLQKIRTMENRVTNIQIRLKNYADAKVVVEELRRLFPAGVYVVETWEDKQGPLLAAIAIEKGILNVLLFLIVAVAGFGILAIFTMIVVEKTRDIGILKALGASNGGVMTIFLAYGLLLGVLGSLLGTSLGITLTEHINEIEKFLGQLTGQDIFPRDIYYFDKIPTDIQPWNVVMVNLGSIAIAVVFSILPALRAALLHPVRALRYE